MRYLQWGIGLCPGRRDLRDWVQDCLVDVVGRYDIDGFCVDHARYPAPANIHSLAACGCPACGEEAERMGWGFDRMREGVRRLREGLRGLTRERALRFVRSGPGFWDFLALAGEDGAVLSWLRFRAMLLAERMREFRDAVQETAGKEKVFGSDVFPPSIALLGGHQYGVWERGADYLTGGSSFGGVVGWATTVTNLATEWAPALCRTVPGLEEGEALKLVYRLFGYEGFGLPLSVEGLRKGPLPVTAMYRREVEKLKAQASANIPLYPPISGNGPAGQVRELCAAVAENGCDGAMLTLDPERGENIRAIREAFRD